MTEEKPQGYPPTQPPQEGYPPPAQQGYPPAAQQGYPPPAQQGYPPQTHPPQGQPPPGYWDPANQPPPGAQAPPPAYPPPQGQQTFVVSTVTATGVQGFRDVPVSVQCPNCQNHVTSNIVLENGALVILIILLIAFVMQLYCGCCLIPLFIDALKDVRHLCPVCSYQLGFYKRL